MTSNVGVLSKVEKCLRLTLTGHYLCQQLFIPACLYLREPLKIQPALVKLNFIFATIEICLFGCYGFVQHNWHLSLSSCFVLNSVVLKVTWWELKYLSQLNRQPRPFILVCSSIVLKKIGCLNYDFKCGCPVQSRKMFMTHTNWSLPLSTIIYPCLPVPPRTTKNSTCTRKTQFHICHNRDMPLWLLWFCSA